MMRVRSYSIPQFDYFVESRNVGLTLELSRRARNAETTQVDD